MSKGKKTLWKNVSNNRKEKILAKGLELYNNGMRCSEVKKELSQIYIRTQIPNHKALGRHFKRMNSSSKKSRTNQGRWKSVDKETRTQILNETRALYTKGWKMKAIREHLITKFNCFIPAPTVLGRMLSGKFFEQTKVRNSTCKVTIEKGGGSYIVFELPIDRVENLLSFIVSKLI